MRFVTSNVNVILMSTIVLLMIFGIAFYNYQEVRFQEVATDNARYESRIEQLEMNLTAQEERLRRIFGELQEQLQDSVKFENLYAEITAERDGLQAEIDDLESVYASEKAMKEAAERDLREAQDEITLLTEERDEFKNKLDQCLATLSACEVC